MIEIHEKSVELICPSESCKQVISSHRAMTMHCKVVHGGTVSMQTVLLQCTLCGGVEKVDIKRLINSRYFIKFILEKLLQEKEERKGGSWSTR